ncbi:hypothetical protein FFIC_210010, partial [Fructobacillus ficulneus]
MTIVAKIELSMFTREDCVYHLMLIGIVIELIK